MITQVEPMSSNPQKILCGGRLPFSDCFERDFLSHFVRVLVAQVTVNFHRQHSAVFVTEPQRNGWNVHSGFNAPGREQVTQIVVSNPTESNFGGGSNMRLRA